MAGQREGIGISVREDAEGITVEVGTNLPALRAAFSFDHEFEVRNATREPTREWVTLRDVIEQWPAPRFDIRHVRFDGEPMELRILMDLHLDCLRAHPALAPDESIGIYLVVDHRRTRLLRALEEVGLAHRIEPSRRAVLASAS